jgi:demethylmenaquinone methyltransferase/2-methoxy-6-polyprenyl-1,4-benzoquinol methylase
MSTFARASVKQDFLDNLYGRIASRYDLVNYVQSLGLVGLMRRDAAAFVGRGVVLDAGAGSGDLAAACLGSGASRVVCLDRSPEMFAVARAKLASYERAGRVRFVLGDVTRLPFRDGAFDNVGSAFVFRNIPSVDAAVGEVRRVLKARGRVAVADVFAPPKGLIGALYKIYLNVMVPLWGRLIARDGLAYRYLSASIRNCFSGEEFAGRLAAAGFADARAEAKFFGVAHVVKGRLP